MSGRLRGEQDTRIMLEKQIESMGARIKRLENQLSTAQVQIDNKEGMIDELNSRIADLEEGDG